MFGNSLPFFAKCAIVTFFVSLRYAEIIIDYVKVNVNSKWEFQCPHVSDVGSYKKIIVSWSLDEAIWLQIDNGSATIINRLITFNRRQLGSSNVYTIVLNDFRYRYYYDEATGDFSMTIQDAREDDSGVWECRIELHKNNGEVEDLKTDAYVLVGNVKPKTTTPYQRQETSLITNVVDNMEQTTSLMYNIEESVSDEERGGEKVNGYNNTASSNIRKYCRLSNHISYIHVIVFAFVMFLVY